MKYYTAQFKINGEIPDISQIKVEVEKLLSEGGSPTSTKYGDIAESANGIVNLEIASDLKKQRLANLLSNIDQYLPAQLTVVGWGWILTGSDPKKTPDDSFKISKIDPFVVVVPQLQAERDYEYGYQIMVKIGFSLLFWGVLILLAFGNLFIPGFGTNLSRNYRQIAYLYIPFAWFLMVLFGVPLLPSRPLRRFHCGMQGVEMVPWFSKTPRFLPWEDIIGLDIYVSSAFIRTHKKAYRFSVDRNAGLKELPMLVKTILSRAQLHYIYGSVGQAIYKRFDAPS